VPALRGEIGERVEAADPRARVAGLRTELNGAAALVGARAEGFYENRRLETQRCLERLDRGRQRAASTRDRVEDLLGRVSASAPRLRRRYADYGTAVGRHERQLRQAADRRVERMREQARHLVTVIRARDFRERGWMLGATERGQPVRSAADLAAGERIELHLHDGRAWSRVEQVEPEDQGENE
jgi:exonuclease VII large subunit